MGLLSLLRLRRPGPVESARAKLFISVCSHVKVNNSAWPGFPGYVSDMYHDEHGVLIFEVYLDPAGPDQPGGPYVAADISQLEVI